MYKQFKYYQLELILDTETNIFFASQRGLSRMIGTSNTSIRNWISRNDIKATQKRLKTPNGIQTVNLISETDINKAFEKYSKALLDFSKLRSIQDQGIVCDLPEVSSPNLVCTMLP